MTPEEPTILDRASDVVYDRDAVHGDPENSFRDIGDLWSAYLGVEVEPIDVAHMMILLKVARTECGTVSEDNYVDMAGYAECAAMLLEDD